jgi:hypothetical protein
VGKQTSGKTDLIFDIPPQAIPSENIEPLASTKWDLAVNIGLRQQTTTATALFQSHLVPLGGGPMGGGNRPVWVPIPLFDQGQARTGRAAAELRRAQLEYYSLAVKIRSTARALRDRAQGARERALYYRDIMLPLHERIVNEAQLHYNAMQLGPVQLLRAREQQIETGAAYVEALRDYLMARTDLAQLLSGRLPGGNGAQGAEAGAAMRGARTQGRNPEGH